MVLRKTSCVYYYAWRRRDFHTTTTFGAAAVTFRCFRLSKLRLRLSKNRIGGVKNKGRLSFFRVGLVILRPR